MPTPTIIWFNIINKPTPRCQKVNRGRQGDMNPIINEVATNHFLVFRTLCLLLSFEFLQLLPLTRQLQLLKGSFSFSLHSSPNYFLWFYLNKCHTTKNPSCKFVDKNRLVKCERFIFDVIFQYFLNLYKLYGYHVKKPRKENVSKLWRPRFLHIKS